MVRENNLRCRRHVRNWRCSTFLLDVKNCEERSVVPTLTGKGRSMRGNRWSVMRRRVNAPATCFASKFRKSIWLRRSPAKMLLLLTEKKLLGNAERAFELCSDAYAELYEQDQSILGQLASVRRRVQDLSIIDGRIGHLLEIVDATIVALQDVGESLRDFREGISFSPTRLGDIENRLSELERLKRKHGRDLQGLLEVRESLQDQLERLGDLAQQENALLMEVEAAASSYIPLAEQLSSIRQSKACLLAQRVTEELREVALERAIFKVQVETARIDSRDLQATNVLRETAALPGDISKPDATSLSFWSSYGADRAEFLVSANVGESVRPLGRVASGGELSRIMLALRTVCSANESAGGRRSGSATLVFDEIDAGIGGRTAEAVGRRLKGLAANRQVLCVTHQAQIARFADHHYTVSKRVEGARTVTCVQKLDREQRIGELARMIGGASAVATARETAVWMLDHSGSGTEENDRPDGREKGSRGKKVKAARRKI